MDFATFADLKLDEFFAEYVTDPGNRGIFQAISQAALDLEQGKKVNFDISIFDKKSTIQKMARPPSLMSSSSISRITPIKADDIIRPQNPTIDTSAKQKIPEFYFKKVNQNEKQRIQEAVKLKEITVDKLSDLLFVDCKLPKCFAPYLLKKLDLTTGEKLKNFWMKYIYEQDPNTRFFRFITGNDRKLIKPEDLVPFVEIMVQNHQSLQFLREEKGFQVKFIDFIVTRCFYQMDTDMRGTVGIFDFRKMDLASIFYKAERMADVNDSQHIFNYQHFYVAFCKFWDLDGDSDGILSKDDLSKFNESAISPIIIDRFFNSKLYPRSNANPKEVDFTSFAYFLMSSEDKTNITSINFWYNLCDLDNDGILSLREIEELYQQQFERMRITGNETIPFDDIFRQLIDMINPNGASYITVQDLLKSKMADVFFNTLFDLQKFLIREYQFPLVNPELDEMTKKLSPWEVYVLIEYDQLVNEGG